MEIRFRLSGIIEVPEGSEIEGERGIRLPNGDLIKLWTTAELNDSRDLDFKAMQRLDIDLNDLRSHLETDEEDA
jgi:hypothetical protein